MRGCISEETFIFCCSILGMHIFGCKFSLKTEAGDTVPDRKNFDSLLWAIVTVFQVLKSPHSSKTQTEGYLRIRAEHVLSLKCC